MDPQLRASVQTQGPFAANGEVLDLRRVKRGLTNGLVVVFP